MSKNSEIVVVTDFGEVVFRNIVRARENGARVSVCTLMADL
jgi:hypothetical protein